METVLQQVARTPKLAGSSLVLEFLGARHGAADLNKMEDTKYIQVGMQQNAVQETAIALNSTTHL